MLLFQVSPLTSFFVDEVGHENYVSLVVSIHHNCFGITFIHALN
jgi:hypothetical protein